MKKLLLLLTTLVAMTACSLCFAADGNDLNKQQKTAERFIDAIDAAPAPEYAAIAPLLNTKLAEKFTDKVYAAWQKNVKEQFGQLKEAKFVAFERLGVASRVTYLGNFAKNDKVAIIFAFDEKNMLLELAFRPITQPAPAQPAEEKAQ
ncbi:MAG: DUF3887 domain-containing protein [Phascolarctobacterium sp.]